MHEIPPSALSCNIRLVVLASTVVFGTIAMALMAQPFIAALTWALTLAVMLHPVERRIRAATRSASLAAIATLVLAAVLVVLPALVVALALANEVAAGATAVAEALSADRIQHAWQGYPALARISDSVAPWLNLSQIAQTVTGLLARWSGQLAQASIVGIVTLLLTFYFLFYVLRDGDRLLAAVERELPLERSELGMITGRVADTIIASVYATLAVAALQGLLGGLMFWMLGLPSPAFWGSLMAVLAIAPFLGAFVVWGPAAAILALQGQWADAAMLAAWGTLVVGLIDNLVYPALVGRRLRLHPMAAFVAIIGGLLLFGTHGVVLGPIIVAVTQALLEIVRGKLDARRSTQIPET